MRIETFAMERLQSRWEHLVDCDLSESGARAVSLAELTDMGLDLRELLATRLGYSQTNGTPALRDGIAALYPGATCDHVLVTNGTAEANYVALAALLADAQPPARCAVELPNYMQASGLARYWAQGGVETFRLNFDQTTATTHGGWRLDWEDVERAIRPGVTAVYITHPNNPTGAVLPESDMRRLVARCDEVGSWLVVDEVYLGTEIDRPRSPTFYGMSERVIVTSGLSKAYGIHGARIGWLVGPPSLVAECWRLRDYTTIAPATLSDAIARFAVRFDVRERLFARAVGIVREQLLLVQDFARSLEGIFAFSRPAATAMALLRYCGPDTTADLCRRLLARRSVLVVDGALLGCDGHIRLWAGAPTDRLVEGLKRIRTTLIAE